MGILAAVIGTHAAAAGAGRAANASLEARRATPPPLCAPAALSATFGGQGATQSLLGGVTVTNHGRGACRLARRPTIAMRGGPPHEKLSERAMNTTASMPGTRFSATVLLDPGHSASAAFQWFNWCTPPANATPSDGAAEGRRPSQVVVSLAAGSRGIVTAVRGGLRALYLPVCVAPRRRSVLYVSLWTTRL